MSRLIYADEVKELLLGLDSLPREDQVDEIVDAIPTAYDVKTVVKELERASFDNTDWGYSGHPDLASWHLLRTKDAIEIVKRGGRNE